MTNCLWSTVTACSQVKAILRFQVLQRTAGQAAWFEACWLNCLLEGVGAVVQVLLLMSAFG